MDERLRKDRPWSEYPIGTRAYSVGGGYWIHVEKGWKWFVGGTYPTPGGDAIGRCIELPTPGAPAMTVTFNRPPLWELMRDAYDAAPPAPAGAGCDWTDSHGYAAEIRALRDWLVPEEDKPNDEFCCPPVSTMLWKQKMDLRALLTTEADRAEPPRRHLFPTPHQIAECGGPCEQGGPEACDCGLYERSSTKSTH